MQEEVKFMNRAKFGKLIEEQVVDKKLSYMEAVIVTCDITNIDPQDVKKFISNVIREKIEAEAMSLNFLPKQNELLFEWYDGGIMQWYTYLQIYFRIL